MQLQQAIETIRDTFGRAFDEERFTFFVKNLLNYMEPDSHRPYQGNYIPEPYRPYIKSMRRIGKYHQNGEILDILVVHLLKHTSLERARTMQRNFIAWYLNGSRGNELKDAALVAFVAPDADDWRFSLVKMDYQFEDGGKVKQEFTPARRWSFLVGENEHSHTARTRFLPLLKNDDTAPALAEIEEAFNIEKVTNEFFLNYRNLFIRTKEELDAVVENNANVKAEFEQNNVDTVNFAKKLLGQIVFLYFLQKKGWFGVGRDDDWGTGSKNFLRELFDKKHGVYSNFFNDILEPLFYEALRIDRNLPAPRPNSFFVYAIKCTDDSLYIGHTQDLSQRRHEHVSGEGAKWTKEHKPCYIAHYEEYSGREEAVKREKELKTGFGRKWLKREIESGRARQAGPDDYYSRFNCKIPFLNGGRHRLSAWKTWKCW